MSVLNTFDLSMEKVTLNVPELQELAKVLEGGLKAEFSTARVTVVNCSDLTKEPYYLVSNGLCGHPQVVDLGGPPYLVPLVQKDKLYDLAQLANRFGFEEALVIGAGAGPWPQAGQNCEGVFNFVTKDGVAIKNKSCTSKVDSKSGDFIVDTLPLNETCCALLANLLYTEGKPGQVIEIECETRTGTNNLISCMRAALDKYYTARDITVALGGVFVLERGAAHQHVMPDFSTTPLHTDSDVNSWLRFYNMQAPLVAVGTLISRDAGLDLRLQHFHSASPAHDRAGHYHWDTTPDIVKYRGCFVPAEKLIRIDRPEDTHNVGRD